MTTLTELPINDAFLNGLEPTFISFGPVENDNASSRREQAGVIYEVRVMVQIRPIGWTEPRSRVVDLSPHSVCVVPHPRRIPINGHGECVERQMP